MRVRALRYRGPAGFSTTDTSGLAYRRHTVFPNSADYLLPACCYRHRAPRAGGSGGVSVLRRAVFALLMTYLFRNTRIQTWISAFIDRGFRFQNT